MMKRYRVAFMGTPELAVSALRSCAAICDVDLVVTQPDRPAGRGKKMHSPPVKVAAEEMNIPVWQPETLRGAEHDQRLQGFDFFVVMAYGEILRQPVLDLPKKECINIHASLLPAWRGASPLQAAIRNGDREGGVSIMRMVRKLDAGPVFLMEKRPLSDRITLARWHDKLADIAAQAIQRFFAEYEDLEAVEQDPQHVSYCGKLKSEDGHIDWSQSAQNIDRLIRAYTPAPGCWSNCKGKRLRILAAQPSDVPREQHPPGCFFRIGKKVYVACGDACLELARVQPAGKPVMDSLAFSNGHQLPVILD